MGQLAVLKQKKEKGIECCSFIGKLHFQEIAEEEEEESSALFYCFDVRDRVEEEWWRLCAHDQLEGS